MTNSTFVSETVMQFRFVMEGVLLPSVAAFGLFGKNKNYKKIVHTFKSYFTRQFALIEGDRFYQLRTEPYLQVKILNILQYLSSICEDYTKALLVALTRLSTTFCSHTVIFQNIVIFRTLLCLLLIFDNIFVLLGIFLFSLPLLSSFYRMQVLKVTLLSPYNQHFIRCSLAWYQPSYHSFSWQ